MRLLLLLAVALGLLAAEGQDQALLPSVPVVIWNRQVTEIRQGWGEHDVHHRADAIAEKLEALPLSELRSPVVFEAATLGGASGLMFENGDRLLFGLTTVDMGTEDPQAMNAIGEAVVRRLEEAFAARLAQAEPEVILRGVLWSVGILVCGVIGLVVLALLHRRIQRRIARLSPKLPRIGGLELAPVARGILNYAVRAVVFFIGATILYLVLGFILAQFPYTQPWAKSLGRGLVDLGTSLLQQTLAAGPGLATVLIIVVITRIAAKTMDAFFHSVENGVLQLQWMEPETAKAMRRIAGILLWLFALTVAYPYIPGSSSDAFKGVSVFAGLLLTLGSAGMVNQVMSGLVVVFSRTMKPGDVIQVGDIAGQVVEQGFLATKLRTPRGHEVSLPNALLVGNSVHNYSRTDERGPRIAAQVTIGYDTPWRQVHGLLREAAAVTPGVIDGAHAEVIQSALSDWYVEYEVRCQIEDVTRRATILSDLHAAIVDAFNTHGVQIMSPHFVAQPAENVLVPKDKWHLPPAAT